MDLFSLIYCRRLRRSGEPEANVLVVYQWGDKHEQSEADQDDPTGRLNRAQRMAALKLQRLAQTEHKAGSQWILY